MGKRMTDAMEDLPGTRAIHGDVQSRAGAVVAPIYQATTFAASSNEEFLDAATRSYSDEFYTRYGNPNHTQVAEVMSALEGAEQAIVTASGMGAISTLALSLLSQGDHVVIQRTTYPGTTNLITNLLARFGISSSYLDQIETRSLEEAIRPETRLVLLETPSNPLLGITDIRAFTEIAHRNGSIVAVDNTVATPINQRPLSLGADLVWHSATKYLGGHSDVSAGVIAGRGDLVERIWRTHLAIGSVLGPIDAWLLLRGIRTLDVRVARHNENALALAVALEQHPEIIEVFYPGLPTHPQHELAQAQMKGFGGLLSFTASGGAARADRVLDLLRLTTRAPSLGSVHSIATRPAAMWSDQRQYQSQVEDGVDAGLIRLSVGIESKEDLLKDFVQALELTAGYGD
jgi:methionine-gamma-lyase